jgi:hypothetical protein
MSRNRSNNENANNEINDQQEINERLCEVFEQFPATVREIVSKLDKIEHNVRMMYDAAVQKIGFNHEENINEPQIDYAGQRDIVQTTTARGDVKQSRGIQTYAVGMESTHGNQTELPARNKQQQQQNATRPLLQPQYNYVRPINNYPRN